MSTPSSTPSTVPMDVENKVASLDEDIRTVQIVHTEQKYMNDNDPPGKRYTITNTQAKLSKLLETAMEDKSSTLIPISKDLISEYAMDKCMEYLLHHNGVEPVLPREPLLEYPKYWDAFRPEESVKFWEDLMKKSWADPWDSDFIKKIYLEGEEKFYDIIRAANYMCMTSLCHLGCSQIGAVYVSMPKKDACKLFGMKYEEETTDDKKTSDGDKKSSETEAAESDED